MRTLLVWLVTLALVAGSTVGVVAQQSEADDEAFPQVEYADPPPGYEEDGPGYYRYGAGTGFRYRFYDGEAWIGPAVYPEVAFLGNELLRDHDVAPEVVVVLSLLFRGPGATEMLELVMRVLLATVGQPPAQEEPPSSVEGQPPAQEEPPSSVEGQPPAQEEPPSSVEAEEPPPSVEDAPIWGMVISLGSTFVSFNGHVTGDAGGWRYEGSSFRSTPGWWHVCHGPADVSCTFKGDPEDPERPNIEMRCTVKWKRVTKDMPATWETLTDAQFEQFWHNTGEFKGWAYKGWTREYEKDGTYKTNYPAVTLRGADRQDAVDTKNCG